MRIKHNLNGPEAFATSGVPGPVPDGSPAPDIDPVDNPFLAPDNPAIPAPGQAAAAPVPSPLAAPAQAERLDLSGVDIVARDPAPDPAADPEFLRVLDEISTFGIRQRGPFAPTPEIIGEKINTLFIAIIDAFKTTMISEGELKIFDEYLDALTEYFLHNPDKMVTDRRPNELDLCRKCKERVRLIRDLKNVGFYGGGKIK